MKKCIIWGTGYIFSKVINSIRYQEKCGGLSIIGVTSNNNLFENYIGYKCFLPSELIFLDFDYIIITAEGENVLDIKDEIIKMGISESKILRYNAFLLPDFDFEKYISLFDSKPTIFADNCWGGITYNKLGLEFMSPFINLYVKNDSYMRFLENPRKYIENTVCFKEMKYAPLVDKYYPLCVCEDIELRFNHYSTFDEAKGAWDRRRKRVNWDNVFYMMITEDRNIASRFCNLPYENKVCFVPFESSEECLYYVDFYHEENGPLWRSVIDMAKGLSYSYSVMDLIQGKKKAS